MESWLCFDFCYLRLVSPTWMLTDSLFAVTIFAGIAQWVSTPSDPALGFVFEISLMSVTCLFVQKLPRPVLFHGDFKLGSQPELWACFFHLWRRAVFFSPLFMSLNPIPITNRFEFVLYFWHPWKKQCCITPVAFWKTSSPQLGLEPLCLLQSFLVTYCDRNDFQNWFGVNLGLIKKKKKRENTLFNVLKLCQDKHHSYLCNECLCV